MTDDDIKRLLPAAWEPFFRRHPALRPVQREAIPLVLDQENVLLVAPTASGKTEAVVAPACQRMLGGDWPGLSCVLLAPTRSLVSDHFDRLERPLYQLSIGLATKSADHPSPPGRDTRLLITTPESLESLLLRHKERLRQLRVIIVDEVHLLDGLARGDQLRLVLSRLTRLVAEQGITLQVVAMSATLPDPRTTATRFLGDEARVIKIGDDRPPIQQYVIRIDSPQDREAATVVAAKRLVVDAGLNKVLAFVASRRGVDTCGGIPVGDGLGGVRLLCHHGSLSRDRRMRVEEAFKSAERAICFATSTLEVGIDIGDVDAVVLGAPPSELSAYMQRVGRSGRRDGQRQAVCIAVGEPEKIIFGSLLQAAEAPAPPGPCPSFRRSVLAQQVLAYLRQSRSGQRTWGQLAATLTTVHAPAVSPDMLRSVVDDLCVTGLLKQKGQVYRIGGAPIIDSPRFVSNISSPPGGRMLVDIDTTRVVATVSGNPRGALAVAGERYEVVGTRGTVVLARSTATMGSAPAYPTGNSWFLGHCVSSAVKDRYVPRERLAAIMFGREAHVLTGLSRPYNLLLAAAGRSRASVGTDLGVSLHVNDESELLGSLRSMVEEAGDPAALDEAAEAAQPDLGGHIGLLSETQQQQAGREYFDIEYLRAWWEAIDGVDIVPGATPQAGEIRGLMRIHLGRQVAL